MYQPLASFDALQLLEAPAAAPVLLAEVKAQLCIEHPDNDLMIDRLIKTAVAYTDAKGALGHAMITQKWGQWVNSVPPQYVRLAMGPLIEVTAVQYYDIDGALQTDTLSNYEITGTDFTTRIGPKSGFNWPVTQDRADAIRIEYTAGYGATSASVPETLRHAMMLLIGHWYDNRENTMMDELSNIPYGFDMLVDMHRRAWYG
jgi:uncharacterized phiE125 gp8 family phage protein